MSEKKFVNQETKIRKGQALNMAVSAAVKDDKSKDTKFIYEMALYYESVITVYQEANSEELAHILGDM